MHGNSLETFGYLKKLEKVSEKLKFYYNSMACMKYICVF